MPYNNTKTLQITLVSTWAIKQYKPGHTQAGFIHFTGNLRPCPLAQWLHSLSIGYREQNVNKHRLSARLYSNLRECVCVCVCVYVFVCVCMYVCVCLCV